MYCSAVSPGGWSDAANGELFPEGNCRLGSVIRLMSSIIGGSRLILQWTSKFDSKLVKSSLSGEVCVPRVKWVDHVTFSRGLLAPFAGMSPGVICSEECERSVTHLRAKEEVAGRYPVRHLLGIHQAFGNNESDNGYWLPGTSNHAGGLTKVKSDMAHFLRMLQWGLFAPARFDRFEERR